MLIIAITLLIVDNAEADQKKLLLAATEWLPYYGENLKNQSFITEVIIEAYSKPGYEVEVKFLPWKRDFEGTKKGIYEGLFTVWYRKEREKWFVYSDPYWQKKLHGNNEEAIWLLAISNGVTYIDISVIIHMLLLPR